MFEGLCGMAVYALKRKDLTNGDRVAWVDYAKGIMNGII